jgi:hypothetical protein
VIGRDPFVLWHAARLVLLRAAQLVFWAAARSFLGVGPAFVLRFPVRACPPPLRGWCTEREPAEREQADPYSFGSRFWRSHLID